MQVQTFSADINDSVIYTSVVRMKDRLHTQLQNNN